MFGGTFVLLAVLTACIAFIPHMGFIALSAIYLGAFLAYMGLRSDPQGGDLFEVIIPFSVLSFIYFCGGTMYLVVVPEVLDQPSLAPFLLPALALVTLGFLCFLVGYGWFFRRTAPSPIGRFAPKSVLVYLLPAAAGAVGISVQKLQSQGMLNDQGISVSHFVHPAVWHPVLLRVVSGVVHVLGEASAPSDRHSVALDAERDSGAGPLLYLRGKGIAVTLLGVPALAYYEVKRKFPVKSVLVVALIFVFIIFPFYNTFRRFDSNLEMTRRVDRTIEMARTWDSDKYLDASVFAFLKRITIVTSVAAIVSWTPGDGSTTATARRSS